jgi:hypothetical protein
MKPSRGTTLAALVLVAVAAPLTAYAVSAGEDDTRPPGHAAGHDKHGDKADKADRPGHATGRERADEASAPGRAHADAMKEWARCVADAASGQKSSGATTPPKDACGDKPMAPGRAKHAPGSGEFDDPGDSSGRSGDHRPSDRGRGHAR